LRRRRRWRGRARCRTCRAGWGRCAGSGAAHQTCSLLPART
jgi:hypothetical protein